MGPCARWMWTFIIVYLSMRRLGIPSRQVCNEQTRLSQPIGSLLNFITSSLARKEKHKTTRLYATN